MVECTGLENRQRLVAFREFESHLLRQVNECRYLDLENIAIDISLTSEIQRYRVSSVNGQHVSLQNLRSRFESVLACQQEGSNIV